MIITVNKKLQIKYKSIFFFVIIHKGFLCVIVNHCINSFQIYKTGTTFVKLTDSIKYTINHWELLFRKIYIRHVKQYLYRLCAEFLFKDIILIYIFSCIYEFLLMSLKIICGICKL